MSFKKLLKVVDDPSKDSVFGYIRQSRLESKDSAIPTMIQYCCLKYYFINEYFSKCSAKLKLNCSKKMITSRGGSGNNRAYGNVVIDLDNKLVTRYKWTIQIKKLNWHKVFK